MAVEDVNIFSDMVQLSAFLTVDVYGRTLFVENESLDIWTSSNGLLTTNQVSKQIAVYDPNANTYTPVAGDTPDQIALVNGLNNAINGKNHDGTPASSKSDAFQDFINNYLSGDAKNKYINCMSEAFGPQMLQALTLCWDKDSGSPSSIQMSIVSGVNQLVSGQAQQNESVGQGAIKSEGSQIQTTTGIPQNISEMINAVLAVLGAVAGLLQQS